MKRVLTIVGVVILVLVVVLIALPFIVDVNMFRPQIESELTTAMGRAVKIGNLKLSIMSGSVSADDLSIAEDPAFGKAPFIRAKGLGVGVELWPLIFSKQLRVTELVIDQPQVALLRNAAGKWNFSSLGGKTEAASARPAQSTNPDLSVGKLAVKNGTVTMDNISDPAKPQVFRNVDITVKGFSFTSKFPFSLSAGLPGGGTAKLDGTAGPMDQTDAALTPLQAKVDVNDLNLAASGFVDPGSGIEGIADFSGTVTSNGHQKQSNGTASIAKLKVSPKGSPAPHAVNLKYATTYDLQKQAGELTQGDITIGKALARLTGGYQTAASTVLNMKLNAENMPVDDLESMLPALGVTLPSGSSLKGGTLTANFTIVGPLDKLVINGPVQLANSKLAGFDLGSKMSAISALAGVKSGSDTTIQNFSTDAHVSLEGISTQNINLNVPSIGVVTGNGTISPQNALNYQMSAKLSGGVVTGLTQLAGLGGKGGGIPFFIQGTTADPKFVPDVKGMLGSQFGSAGKGQSPANLVNGISGLFGKKKP
ncbi:MAG: AsmA family protein [Terriglobales bacterium]